MKAGCSKLLRKEDVMWPTIRFGYEEFEFEVTCHGIKPAITKRLAGN